MAICHVVDLIFSSITVSSNDKWFIDKEIDRKRRKKIEWQWKRKQVEKLLLQSEGKNEWNIEMSPMS